MSAAMRNRARPVMLTAAALTVAVTLLTTMSSAPAPAGTSPRWYVGGAELSGAETYGGVAEPSSMSVAGVTTTCRHAYYVASIFNSGGLGKGEVTSLPSYECSASGAGCELAKAEAKKLPWPARTVFVEGRPYLVIEGVDIETSYNGAACPLKGTQEVTGSVGAALENGKQRVVFSRASATATGASLRAAGSAVEYAAAYTAEDVGPSHHEQVVEAR